MDTPFAFIFKIKTPVQKGTRVYPRCHPAWRHQPSTLQR